jgi:hypothetical protein
LFCFRFRFYLFAAKKVKLSPGSAAKGGAGEAKAKDGKKSSGKAAGGAAEAAGSQSSQAFEFSEAGLRQFITVRGAGRTTLKQILVLYKKQMKSMGVSGQTRLKEILIKVSKLIYKHYFCNHR